MTYQRYVCYKRARFTGICGQVNIPYGTAVESRDGFLFFGQNCVCAIGSQNGCDHFVQDDDGQGLYRGKLVQTILRQLQKRDNCYQGRWNRIWEDRVSALYRRTDHEDDWLWARSFYDAPIGDLQHIAALVGRSKNKIMDEKKKSSLRTVKNWEVLA